MEKNEWLTTKFQETRTHLNALAFRMLGSTSEAEDAVQETWCRLNRTESENIENLSGWLTTVVARVCLDMLRARKAKHEKSFAAEQLVLPAQTHHNPETQLLVADSVSTALLVVLDRLTPGERIAFVLHDLFDLPFDEIAPIIDRSETTTRQLASRARRQVRGASTEQEINGDRRKAIVSAFLAAAREGDFNMLISLLHPDVVLRADDTAIKVAQSNASRGAPQFRPEIIGANHVATTFNGKAKAAQPAFINGVPGATWAPGGKPIVAFCFSVEHNQIAGIEIVMEKTALNALNIVIDDDDNKENSHGIHR